jgi:endonuclease/exonuclease/phosphatase family metal-dependent hydrolase
MNRVFHTEPDAIVPVKDIEEMWRLLCDGGETMDKDCMRRALKTLHLRAFSDRKLAKLLQAFDVNRDGVVDFDEFLLFVVHPHRNLLVPGITRIAPGLFLGSAADSRNSQLLQKLGITHLLNASSEVPNSFEGKVFRNVETEAEYSFAYLRVPIEDKAEEANALYDHLHVMWQFTNDARSGVSHAMGGNSELIPGACFVHCCDGNSRAAAAVIALLMGLTHTSLQDACTLLTAKRSSARPNDGFLSMLHFLDADLFNKQSMPHAAAAVQAFATGGGNGGDGGNTSTVGTFHPSVQYTPQSGSSSTTNSGGITDGGEGSGGGSAIDYSYGNGYANGYGNMHNGYNPDANTDPKSNAATQLAREVIMPTLTTPMVVSTSGVSDSSQGQGQRTLQQGLREDTRHVGGRAWDGKSALCVGGWSALQQQEEQAVQRRTVERHLQQTQEQYKGAPLYKGAAEGALKAAGIYPIAGIPAVETILGTTSPSSTGISSAMSSVAPSSVAAIMSPSKPVGPSPSARLNEGASSPRHTLHRIYQQRGQQHCEQQGQQHSISSPWTPRAKPSRGSSSGSTAGAVPGSISSNAGVDLSVQQGAAFGSERRILAVELGQEHIAYATRCLYQQGVSYMNSGGFHAHMFRMGAKHWRQLCNKLFRLLSYADGGTVWKRVLQTMQTVDAHNNNNSMSSSSGVFENPIAECEEEEEEGEEGAVFGRDEWDASQSYIAAIDASASASATTAATVGQVLELISGTNDKRSELSREHGLRIDGRGATPTTSSPSKYTALPDYEKAWALLDPCLGNTALGDYGVSSNNGMDSTVATASTATMLCNTSSSRASSRASSRSGSGVSNGVSNAISTSATSTAGLSTLSTASSASFSIDYDTFRDVLIPIACDVIASRGHPCTVEHFLEQCAEHVDLHGSVGVVPTKTGAQAGSSNSNSNSNSNGRSSSGTQETAVARKAAVVERRRLEQSRWEAQYGHVASKAPVQVQFATINIGARKEKEQQKQQQAQQQNQQQVEEAEKAKLVGEWGAKKQPQQAKSASVRAVERSRVQRARVEAVVAEEARADALMGALKRLVPGVGVLALQEATECECAMLATTLGGVQVGVMDNFSRSGKHRAVDQERGSEGWRGGNKEDAKYYYCWLPSQTQGLNSAGAQQGNAVISRYPIDSYKAMLLPGGFGEKGRTALGCEVLVRRERSAGGGGGGGGTSVVTVVSVQLDEMAEETRVEQARVLLQEVRRWTQRRRVDRLHAISDGETVGGRVLDAVDSRLKRDAQRGSSHSHDKQGSVDSRHTALHTIHAMRGEVAGGALDMDDVIIMGDLNALCATDYSREAWAGLRRDRREHEQEAPLQKVTSMLRANGFLDAVEGGRAAHTQAGMRSTHSHKAPVELADFDATFARSDGGSGGGRSSSSSGNGDGGNGGGTGGVHAYSTKLCATDAHAMAPTCFVSGDPSRCKLSLVPVRTDYIFLGKGFMQQHTITAGSYRVLEPRGQVRPNTKQRQGREMVLVTDHSVVVTAVGVAVP